jgi:Aminoglycoside-2''-adenylyltransferase
MTSTTSIRDSGLTGTTHDALVAIVRCIIPSMFNAQQPWALVGSTASVLQGFPNYRPPDIDLATTMEGAYVMSRCIGNAGNVIRPVRYSVRPPYSSYFGIFEVLGVKVEVMGDLVIRCADGVIDVSDHWARWSDTVRICQLDDLHIPVVPLEWQIIANAMLGRDDRVDALAAHVLQCGYDREYMANLFADPRIGARTIERVRRALRFDG